MPKISRLQEALNAAITEKEQAIAKAQIDMDRAQQNTDLANRLQKEAMDTMNKAEEDAAAQIEAIKKETTAQIEKVMSEKEQHAVRRDEPARLPMKKLPAMIFFSKNDWYGSRSGKIQGFTGAVQRAPGQIFSPTVSVK